MTTQGEQPSERQRYRPSGAQWTLATIVVVFAIGVVVWRALGAFELNQTSALYIGLPALLAVLLALSRPARSPYGMVLKSITLFLLLAMVLLGEGLVCVLFSAPLFYGVGLAVSWFVVQIRTAAKGEGRPHVVVLPALLALAVLEGVTPALSFPGDASVSASRTVDADPQQVETALGKPLLFDAVPLTGVLTIGFPQPHMDHVDGIDIGDRRTIVFDGAHHRSSLIKAHHWGEHSSHLTMEVAERTSNSLVLRAVSDDTPISTWLSWRTATVRWWSVGDHRTEISWVLDYHRELAPAWYFGPVERVVTQRAADHLLRSIDLRQT